MMLIQILDVNVEQIKGDRQQKHVSSQQSTEYSKMALHHQQHHD